MFMNLKEINISNGLWKALPLQMLCWVSAGANEASPCPLVTPSQTTDILPLSGHTGVAFGMCARGSWLSSL